MFPTMFVEQIHQYVHHQVVKTIQNINSNLSQSKEAI